MARIAGKYNSSIPLSTEEMIVELILRNKSASQFIEEFNASDEIDFFEYTKSIALPYAKKYGCQYALTTTLYIQYELLSRVVHRLADTATDKVKKFVKTEAAWVFFAQTFEKRERSKHLSENLKKLRNAYISASLDDYLACVDAIRNVSSIYDFSNLSIESDYEEIARIAFSMYNAKDNPIEQIELPAFEF